jgi:hypothetical protein
MFIFPDTERKLKTRISSYRSSLRKEKKERDYISDGSGKRYILFSLYLILNDLEKSNEYFEWYCKEFHDDSGEPFQKLCWAIGLFRMNRLDEARQVLAETMLSNLYLIPNIIGVPLEEEYDIWHSSNFENLYYSTDLPSEINDNIQENELIWMKETYESFDFRRINKSYRKIYHQLKSAEDIDERRKLLKESNSLLGSIKCS